MEVFDEEIWTRKLLPCQVAFSRAIPNQFDQIMSTRAPRRDRNCVDFFRLSGVYVFI